MPLIATTGLRPDRGHYNPYWSLRLAAKIENSPLDELSFDIRNFRLKSAGLSQHKCLEELARGDRKLVALARDIVQEGINPADLPIVVPDGDARIVIEGNRRLAALRLLSNPRRAAQLAGPFKDTWAELCRSFKLNPITSLQCLVVETRQAADHWVKLRHYGESGGAGIVKWGAKERARYAKAAGKRAQSELAVDLLDEMEESGLITSTQAHQVPVTNLQRLIGSPEVRKLLGLGTKLNPAPIHSLRPEVRESLVQITKDLASGDKKVGDLYKVPAGVGYVQGVLDSSIGGPQTPSRDAGAQHRGAASPPSPDGAPAAIGRRRSPTPRDHPTLIPPRLPWHISCKRCRDIVGELSKLELATYPNAVALLLRALIDLSTVSFGKEYTLNFGSNATLAIRVNKVLESLVKDGRIEKGDEKAVKNVAQSNSFNAGSLDSLQGAAHNPGIIPNASDLRASWRGFEPLLLAIWAHPK